MCTLCEMLIIFFSLAVVMGITLKYEEKTVFVECLRIQVFYFGGKMVSILSQ